MTSQPVVEISNVWKIFGSRAQEALRAVREGGLSKAEALSEFNAVVGVADVHVREWVEGGGHVGAGVSCKGWGLREFEGLGVFGRRGGIGRASCRERG